MYCKYNIDTIMERQLGGVAGSAGAQHVLATTCIMDDSGLC